MRRPRQAISLVALVALFSSISAAQPAQPVHAHDAAATVPVIPLEATSDMPDPHVVVDGGRYVTFASATKPSGFFRQVPVATSPDLLTFTAVGDALAVPAAWSIGDEIWAPAVARLADSWRLFYATRHAVFGMHCLSVATASMVQGPYADGSPTPLLCDPYGGDAIDPEPFVDADGSPWLLWRGRAGPDDPRASLWSQRVADDGLSLVGDRARLLVQELAWEQPVIESPSMVRWAGAYVLFYSGGTFVDERYAIGHALCDGPAGPCSRAADAPLLASGGDLVGPGGQSAFVGLRGRLRLAFHSWASAVGGAEPVTVRRLNLGWVVGRPPSLRVVRQAFGVVDEVIVRGSQATVRGWVIDPTTDGGTVLMATAGSPAIGRPGLAADHRPDVAAAFPGYGPNVGFTVTIPWNKASRHACVYTSAVEVGCRRGVAQ